MIRIMCLLLMLQLSVSASDVEKWSISVYGSAKVEVVAELATIVYGVSEKGASIDEAYAKMKTVIKAANLDLRRLGVKESDIFVSNFSSGDNYWGNSAFFKADNFQASSRVTITNLDVSQVEAVILSLGKNEIDKILSVVYSLKSDAPHKQRAREMALLAAREKAIQMAQTLKGSIGDAIAIEEIPGVSEAGYSAIASRGLRQNPFNAVYAYEVANKPEMTSFYPEKISIEQHVRVVFHLIQ
ncbi:MAG: SIMPL domain-containing protein [Candidatus Marinimicrobia bacterium]|nr:SIMPL domain-containing protein [Candidatus Neomarinimicrobiota bacterium]MCF7921771.1 SIMPL domain-containing protein [Candidatus Neomarinimicrobiota bacterium]